MRSSFALLIFAIALGTLGAGFSPCSAQTNFLRGDCNGDGSLNLADAIQLLGVLFSGDPAPSCTDACDFNDDGTNNIADAISGLGYLFSGDPDLPPPFLVCGVDPTADSLACPDFPVCPQGQAEICNSGVDEDLDGAIDCMDSDCFTDPACAVSHSVDIQPIWDANCLFCHSPPMPPMNLDLNPGPAYSLLIDIESNECFVFDRVEPGNPTASWLFRKVTGTHTANDVQAAGCTPAVTGGQMPLMPFCCLSQGELDLIELWIAGGANP